MADVSPPQAAIKLVIVAVKAVGVILFRAAVDTTIGDFNMS